MIWKALTIRQPWAWATIHAGKNPENRSGGSGLPRHRGWTLIHAGSAWSNRGGTDPRILDALPPSSIRTTNLFGPVQADASSPLFTFGAIIGMAELDDVHRDARCCRPWGESEYLQADGTRRTDVVHLRWERIVALDEPVDVPGLLGLWTPPDYVVDEVLAQVDVEALGIEP